MKSIKIELFESDLTYIFNCITLTRKILQQGNPDQFFGLFKKEYFVEYEWDLNLMQQLLKSTINKEFYGEDIDKYEPLPLSYKYYRYGGCNFNFVLKEVREKHLKEIKENVEYCKKIQQIKEFKQAINNMSDSNINKIILFFQKFKIFYWHLTNYNI